MPILAAEATVTAIWIDCAAGSVRVDLTTLTYVFVFMLGFLGLDAAVHAPDVILEANATGSYGKATITTEMAQDVLKQEVNRISSTPTVMTKPVFRVGRLQGLGMSVAEALKMQSIAYSFQAQLGYRPDEIKLTLFGEGGTAKVLVTGIGEANMSSFQQQLQLETGESVVDLLRRATMVGMAHVDPYLTALNEMQIHATDKDFSHAESIIKYATEGLPPTPVNFDRSLLENLSGLVALFKGDPQTAHDWFRRARESCPTDENTAHAITTLNEAFTDLQNDHDADAVKNVTLLLSANPPTDKILLSTSYMTLAAAQLGVKDAAAAELMIAKAVETYPETSSAYDLWSDIKREMGDQAQADLMHRKALENSVQFENYAEIAALYFRLAWRDNQPVMQSPFNNLDVVGLHASPGGS